MNLEDCLFEERYHIMSKIGQGGMGIVYKAIDTQTQQPVALKFLLFEFETNRRKRFGREFQTLAQLNHPHILRVFDYREKSLNGPFFVMEFLDGEPLSNRAVRPQSVTDIVTCAQQLFQALAEIHRHGIIHRDLKPANVMRLMPSEHLHLKLMDFGLVKHDDFTETLTQSGEIVGTLAYISPEQATGRPQDHRSDLYSAGVLLYELIAGRPPFVADSFMLILLHAQDTPPPLTEFRPDIPPELAQVVHRLLEKEPEARFASAQEVVEILSAIQKRL